MSSPLPLQRINIIITTTNVITIIAANSHCRNNCIATVGSCDQDRVLAVVREGGDCMLRYFDEQGNKLNELQLDVSTCIPTYLGTPNHQ